MSSSLVDGWNMSSKIEKMHTIYEYATKWMVQWNEFAAARDILEAANPECAGFILGLEPVLN